MIFSIICEELGLFGAISLILIFMFMIYRFMVIAGNAPDLLGAMIVTGVMAHIAIPGYFEYCRSYQLDPQHGRYTAVYQLWRHIGTVSDAGEGAGA